MHRLRFLFPLLLTVAVGSVFVITAEESDDVYLGQIRSYRSWTRVTPEILKTIPDVSLAQVSAAG